MKAKYTEMTVDDCLKLYEKEGIIGLVEKVRDISFKAGQDQGYGNGHIDGYNEATQKAIKDCYDKLVTGRKAGIKEVVEWIQKYSHLKDDGKNLYLVMDESWQSKLREWGYEATE